MTKRDKPLRQHASKNDLIGMDGELKRPLSVPKTEGLPHSYADKKQDRFRPRSPELHFTTSLYIDQAIELLRAQAEKANDRGDILIIKFDVSSVDADRARFKLESLRMGKITGRLEGTLQRWQGSRTRVDVDAEHRPLLASPDRVKAIFGMVMFLGIFIVVVISLLAQRITLDATSIFILFVVLLVLFANIAMYLNLNKEVETNLLPKKGKPDVNELIDILENAYGDYDLKWIDKSD